MTSSSPLPILIASAAPAPMPVAATDRNASATKKGPSFSDVLAQQRPASQNDTKQSSNAKDKKQPAVNENAQKSDQTVASKPKPAAPKDGAQPDAAQSDEDTSAVDEAAMQALVAAQAAAAQIPVVTPPSPTLADQALAIAAQSTAQVQVATEVPANAPMLSANAAAATLPASLIGKTQGKEAVLDADTVTDDTSALSALAEPKLAKSATSTLEQIKPVNVATSPTVGAVLEQIKGSTSEPGHTRYVAANKTALPGLDAPQVEAPLNPILSGAVLEHAATVVPESAATLAAAALAAAAPRDAVNPIRIPVPGNSIPVMLQVSSPIGAVQWGTDLGQQLVVLGNYAQQGRQTAELRLDPPDLGPLRVSITLNDGIASAAFVSAHAAVRQAIETALPQLQQALAQAGISLGQTSVGDQPAQQGFAEQFSNGNSGKGANQNGQGNSSANQATLVSAPIPTRAPSNGLVDTFA